MEVASVRQRRARLISINAVLIDIQFFRRDGSMLSKKSPLLSLLVQNTL
jgi:hypothetical protein